MITTEKETAIFMNFSPTGYFKKIKKFHWVILSVSDHHAPMDKQNIGAKNSRFKELRKDIVVPSRFRNGRKFWKHKQKTNKYLHKVIGVITIFFTWDSL